MANEINVGMYIDWDDYQNQLNWFKPIEPPQLLPKDILKGSRMISGEEAERHILNAITRPSMYSHSNRTNQLMMPNAMLGATSATASQITWSRSYSTFAASTIWPGLR